MAKAIGSSFSAELAAAGLLGLPFSWSPDGDLTFGAAMTTDQISAVEAVYTAHNPATVPLVTQAQAALVAGVSVTSTGTPAINGTYDISPASQGRLAAVSTYILVNSKFPGGVTSYGWVDTSGVPHVFPSTALFQAFATAIADRVSVLEQIARLGVGTIPTAAVGIA